MAPQNTPPKSARIVTRVSQEQKDLIERAAAFSGRTVSDFVLAHTEVAAKKVIEEHEKLRLDQTQSRALVDALLAPKEPNGELKRAMKNYRKLERTRLVPTLALASLFWTFSPNARSDEPAQDQIAAWIAQLADPNYAKRQFAKSELERLGVSALDQLHEASLHPDPQVASAARFLIQSNQFLWAWDFDSSRVRSILMNYAASENNNKLALIKELARLEREEGIPALCRLARYETVSALSKWAAIQVLKAPTPIGMTDEQHAAKILRYIDGGGSVASQWLIAHFGGKEFAPAWWRAQIDSENKLLANGTHESSSEIVSELTRWQIQNLANRPEFRQQAIELGESYLSANAASVTSFSETAEEFAIWALEMGLPELVQKQHAFLTFRSVERSPIYSYLLAESFHIQGNAKLAEEIAKLAFDQIPVDAQGNRWEPKEADLPPKGLLDFSADLRFEAGGTRRYYIGSTLKKRGRFDWAVRELELSAADDLTQPETRFALYALASIHHSFERYAEASAVLEPFAKRMEKEPMFRNQLMDQSTSTLLSSYYLYTGDAKGAEGDIELAASNYFKALDTSADNVDALIGLYKLDITDQAEIATERASRLKTIVREHREQIRKYEQFLSEGAGKEFFESFSPLLAMQLNSLAWLLANTEGDFNEAVQMSRRACSLQPQSPEFLDTLAHAYFAAGEWKDAVEQQRRAVKLSPHLPEFQRALTRFEAKLAEMEK